MNGVAGGPGVAGAAGGAFGGAQVSAAGASPRTAAGAANPCVVAAAADATGARVVVAAAADATGARVVVAAAADATRVGRRPTRRCAVGGGGGRRDGCAVGGGGRDRDCASRAAGRRGGRVGSGDAVGGDRPDRQLRAARGRRPAEVGRRDHGAHGFAGVGRGQGVAGVGGAGDVLTAGIAALPAIRVLDVLAGEAGRRRGEGLLGARHGDRPGDRRLVVGRDHGRAERDAGVAGTVLDLREHDMESVVHRGGVPRQLDRQRGPHGVVVEAHAAGGAVDRQQRPPQPGVGGGVERQPHDAVARAGSGHRPGDLAHGRRRGSAAGGRREREEQHEREETFHTSRRRGREKLLGR